MHSLDETDLEILRLLVEDARRPFREIGESVDLSPPAVSDRVSRLQEQGIIRRFTVDVDRSQLREGTPVLVRLSVAPNAVSGVRDAVADLDAVEHHYVTVEDDVLLHANAPDDVGTWLDRILVAEGIRDVEVSLLRESHWSPTVGATDFATVCDECGNTVTSEGVTTRVGGDVKQFCCESCESRYVERYDQLSAGAE
jgi:DNA-binding Lrp family transcriptional regulator